MSWNPAICIDFDGVIHSYTSGWKGEDVIADPPVPGAIEWLMALLREYLKEDGQGNPPTGAFRPMIYSSRSRTEEGIRLMKTWFFMHGMPRHYVDALEFPREKPAAWLTIDDRAVCFEGTFPTTREMLEFTPWNQRTSPPERPTERSPREASR